MVNFNGDLVHSSELNLSVSNRAFLYGDAVFDTLRFSNGRCIYLEDHYFRLMSSMRLLRMKIPMDFTLEHYQSELQKTVEANSFSLARIRVTIFRSGQGKYSPNSNKIHYLIEAEELQNAGYDRYEIELYKDHTVSSDFLSTIKTTNRIINVLAGIYSDENAYDNCLLINEKKQIVEAINANVFLVKGNELHTPDLGSGCVQGIIRKKIIELLKKSSEYEVIEKEVSPFDLLKADEVFLTNSVIGVQPVSNYRKKQYKTAVGLEIKKLIEM